MKQNDLEGEYYWKIMSLKKVIMKTISKLSCAIVVMIIVACGCVSFASAGVLYEEENNNTYSNAKLTYNDYDNYGLISSISDTDWWKIRFGSSGPANFWLGNIPSGCNYQLEVYSSNGTTLLYSSTNSGSSNEIISFNVSAYTLYYIRIYSSSGFSNSQYYKLRAKVYPSKTISGVPLYKQQETTTCGPASIRMTLAKYGITKAESTIKARATVIAGSYADYTYVWVVKDTLNYFLNDSGSSTRYKYTPVSLYTLTDFTDLVVSNMINENPCISLIYVYNSSYLPYNSDGHYVVLKGMTYSSGSYTATINDPHYSYYDTYYVPISEILYYTQVHPSGGYIIHVVD